MTTDPHWRDDAACATHPDPELWFAEASEHTKARAAQVICWTCPVKDRCAAEAKASGQVWGVWGGVHLNGWGAKADRQRVKPSAGGAARAPRKGSVIDLLPADTVVDGFSVEEMRAANRAYDRHRRHGGAALDEEETRAYRAYQRLVKSATGGGKDAEARMRQARAAAKAADEAYMVEHGILQPVEP